MIHELTNEAFREFINLRLFSIARMNAFALIKNRNKSLTSLNKETAPTRRRSGFTAATPTQAITRASRSLLARSIRRHCRSSAKKLEPGHTQTSISAGALPSYCDRTAQMRRCSDSIFSPACRTPTISAVPARRGGRDTSGRCLCRRLCAQRRLP